MNVARLAGLPTSVVARAATIAHQAEVCNALTGSGMRPPVVRQSSERLLSDTVLAGPSHDICFSVLTALALSQAADAARQQATAPEDDSTEDDGGSCNVSDITQAAAVRQIRQLLAADDQATAAATLTQMQARLKRLLVSSE